MQPTEEFQEPERSYPSLKLGRLLVRLLIVNVPIVTLVIGLINAANKEQGYLGGLGQMMAVVGLMGLGGGLNLVLAIKAKNSRAGYLLVAVLYGVVFFLGVYSFGQIKSLKPGG